MAGAAFNDTVSEKFRCGQADFFRNVTLAQRFNRRPLLFKRFLRTDGGGGPNVQVQLPAGFKGGKGAKNAVQRMAAERQNAGDAELVHFLLKQLRCCRVLFVGIFGERDKPHGVFF